MCLALAPPADGSFPGQNGSIVSADREQGDIYSYSAAGARRLTRDGSRARRGSNFGPEFSADGRLIAWERADAVWVMGADGAGKRQLTPDSLRAGSPSWSPDGRRIAFRGDAGVVSGLFVMNSDGSEPQFIEGERQSTAPAWSPSGDLIAAISATPSGDDRGVDLVTPDGSARRRLVSGGDWEGVEWSPDGGRLALTRHVPGGDGADAEIWLISADGTGLRRLRAHAGRPVWSPDGRLIAFVATAGCAARTGDGGEDDSACHRVMNADGSRARRLPLTSPADDWQACFAACRPPLLTPIRVVVSPRVLHFSPATRSPRARLRFRVTVVEQGRRRPLAGATVILSALDETVVRRGGPVRGPDGLLAGPRARTNRLGRATIRRRFDTTFGRFRVEVMKRGFLTGIGFLRLR